MSFLRPAYNKLKSDDVVKMSSFLDLFKNMNLKDADFNTERFVPGSSGERALFRTLMVQSGLNGYE